MSPRSGAGLRSRFLIPRPTLYPSVLSVALLLLHALPCAAQHSRPTESQVEAAYLYNFGKFVTFPQGRATNSNSFSICILGKDPFGEVLDATVQGESVNGKRITVQRLSRLETAQECGILFVSSSEEDRLPFILATARQMGLLTVSDIGHFAELGGIIELARQEDRIRFAVNLKAAQQSHLVLSSELLKVAIRVIDKDAKGK